MALSQAVSSNSPPSFLQTPQRQYLGSTSERTRWLKTPRHFPVTLRGFEGGFDPFGGGAGEGALTEPLARADVSILDDDCEYKLSSNPLMDPKYSVWG